MLKKNDDKKSVKSNAVLKSENKSDKTNTDDIKKDE